MKKALIALVAFCLFGFGIAIRAQNAIPASGGNATGSAGDQSVILLARLFILNTPEQMVVLLKEYNNPMKYQL